MHGVSVRESNSPLFNFVYNDTFEQSDGSLATISQEAAFKVQYTIRF